MTRQEIERIAKLEQRNEELAKENAELRRKQSNFTNGDTSNLNGVETFFMTLVKDGKLQQMPANYDCATLKMYISHLENENAELKQRLEKAVELRFSKGDKAYAIIDTLFYTDVFPVTIEAVDIVYEVFDGELTTRQHSTRLFTDRTKAEQRLAELKGGKQ